jgi:uncharacterized pyridoxamine 5'-phosphate oxidase family protein
MIAHKVNKFFEACQIKKKIYFCTLNNKKVISYG